MKPPTLIRQENDPNPVEKTLMPPRPPSSPTEKEDDADEEGPIHLVNEGAYGCIYHPGINCYGNRENKNYITKIQKTTAITQNEMKISEIIRKKIRGFRNYFAPIMKQCNVSIQRKYVADIKKCQVFREDSEDEIVAETYVSNKVLFLGTQNVEDYLYQAIDASEESEPQDIHEDKDKDKKEDKKKDTPMGVWEKILKTHIRLLDGIQLLLSADIIHLDLKPGNIMVDPGQHHPILIDFGISIDRESLNKETAKDAFYIYDTYTPWCIDIMLCNYAINMIKSPDMQIVSESEIESILETFQYGFNSTPVAITTPHSSQRPIKNEVFISNTPTTIDTFMKNLRAYLKTTYVDSPTTWTQVYTTMVQMYSHTWDNYSISIMFLNILNRIYNKAAFHQIEMASNGKLGKYQSLLESVVYATPDKRASIENVKEHLMNLLIK